VAFALTDALEPNAAALAVAVVIDAAVGDPVYSAHPVRLMGRTLQGIEEWLRRCGADGYFGGIALFVILAVLWVGGLSLALMRVQAASGWMAWVLHVALLYSLLALGDLFRHGWQIERALDRGDLPGGRAAVSQLVGRDTDRMDAGACRRAAIESLSESLTDGFVSPVFWYVLLGIPGVVLFKVVSTMDSMVGYKTPRYLRFGWCGARLDDVMNFVPARLTWLLLTLTAAVLPRSSARKAFRIGLEQHALVPGPNAGWSEAATAGAIERRLVGPIWIGGAQVTDLWLGDPGDRPADSSEDFSRATVLIAATAALAALVACVMLAPFRSF
jgi:adenosylcobinamide-phosphate synthase